MSTTDWILGLIGAFVVLDVWLVLRLWRRARAARARAQELNSPAMDCEKERDTRRGSSSN